MKLIYTILLYFIQPIIWIKLLIQSSKISAYRYRWKERYGFCKNKVIPKGILVHSVSVGETLTAIPLIRTLRQLYPLIPITVTTKTPTGSERVISTLGKDVCHVYLPYDLPCAMNRFLNIVYPILVIIMETEIWPNMIYEIYSRKIPIIIANARLSERSAKNYKKIHKFICKLLNKVTLIAAQNEEDAMRFSSLGIKSNRIIVTGNLKFDILVTSKLVNQAIILRKQWAPKRQVYIAASTHDGEENIILKAHRKLLINFPSLLLIIVPRHPERFKKVCTTVKKMGFSFILRSSGGIPLDTTQVVIGDTMGELMLLYGIADIAFVGGSLVKKGGHNPLEPAAHAIPIVMGPYTFNFKDICIKLKQAKGLITVVNESSVVNKISNLLINKKYRLACGYQAIKTLHQNQGALYNLINILKFYLPPVDY